MDTKHTTGPWTHRRAFSKGEEIGCVVMPMGYDLSTSNNEENEANARLIAAAPDLLEALEGLLKATRMAHGWAQNCGPQYADDDAVFVGEWIDEARAAIAKATQP